MTNQGSKPTSREPAIVKLLPEDHFFQRIAGLRELIARHAYKLFEDAGFQHGHDLEHWLLAESQLLCSITPVVTQEGNTISVKAALPGFDAKNVEVHVQPHQLFITGERMEESQKTEGKTAHSEQLLQRVFRAVELPEEIDPDKANATLNNGELQIDLPKAKAQKKAAQAKKAVA